MNTPIFVTDAAKNRFKEMLTSSTFDAIRFGVKGGGCSGFQYYLEFNNINQLDKLDEIIEFDDVKIIIDGSSIVYLIGTTIDWINDIMGSHFEFKSINQSSKCGCGTSVNFKV
ncbi:MAG: iron-sulfur cluster assembly accessory protein [Richelia sp. RM2_1_2]|nr:iron-sulfur cluster assembly accessory protein [Richelia sp. RM2_1_2]